jgi:hypothetical protein
MSGGRSKKSRAQERAIAALLTESTRAAAAQKAGVSEATLGRWLKDPAFGVAYHHARRDLVRAAVERLQGGVGEAVEALRSVAKDGKKDGDRVRAAVALLDHAFRGIGPPDAGAGEPAGRTVDGTAGVVRLLAGRLGQLDAADLPTPEKARLTATLADAMLRAIGVDVLDKRLETLQAVLLKRGDGGP